MFENFNNPSKKEKMIPQSEGYDFPEEILELVATLSDQELPFVFSYLNY